MIVKFALLPLVVALAVPQLRNDAKTGQLAGQLVDSEGQATYVGEVVVFLCDASTGYPIDRETRKPIEITRHDLPIDRFWYAVTDERGTFEFPDVPVGQYRLIAQSWSGTQGLPKPFGKTSTFVLLQGVVENVAVKPGEPTTVSPRPLGKGVLRLTNDPPEAHAFLLISLKPTLGDAILGPFGWGDEFIRQVVGVTHMERAQVTIIGLPEDRPIHVALFNYDNNPGFGTGTYQAGQREGKLRIVASWSNAHHEPPRDLKELTDHLEANHLQLSDFVKEEVKGESQARRQLYESLRQDPKREVEVPGLGKRRLVDVLAASGYVRLRAAFKK